MNKSVVGAFGAAAGVSLAPTLACYIEKKNARPNIICLSENPLESE